MGPNSMYANELDVSVRTGCFHSAPRCMTDLAIRPTGSVSPEPPAVPRGVDRSYGEIVHPDLADDDRDPPATSCPTTDVMGNI